MEEFSRCLVGIVRVDISSIAFQDVLEAKKIDSTKIQNLIEDFRENGCNRDSPENQVPALVSTRELDYMLEIAQVTQEDLQRSLLEGEYPTLSIADNTIYCLDGRHRLRAAELFFNDRPEEKWWTIRLNTFNPRPHEAQFSDGEVLRKAIYYTQRLRRDLAEDWKVRLTESKQDCLSAVLARKDFREVLGEILRFPGLSDGVKLSYWKSYFALHIDEELLNCLWHIHDIWSRITLGSVAVRQAVQIHTVRKLQNRAPAASLVDRLYIEREIDKGMLFPTIVDRALRQRITEAILGVGTVIPTFKYFYENTNYLAIPAKVIQKELLDGRITTTLRKTLYDHFSQGNIIEEIREGHYRQAVLPDGVSPTLFAYLQLFLGEMRHFPCRGKHSPKMERKRKRGGSAALLGHADKACQPAAFERAYRLGFRTHKIMEGRESANAEGAPEFTEHLMEDDEDHGEVENRRSGRPFANAYKQLRTQLFLANLSRVEAGLTAHPSVLFIQRDIIGAFFGQTVFSGLATSVVVNPANDVARERIAPDLESPAPDTPPPQSMGSPQLSPMPAPNARRLGLPPGIRERWGQLSRELGILHDSDAGSERSQPRPSTGSVADERRSLTRRDLEDERRSFPALEGNASDEPRVTMDLEERRSFPTLERRASPSGEWQPTRREFGDERRSFPVPRLPAPALRTAGHSGQPTSTVSQNDSPPFTFVEYNSRGQEVVSTADIERHLRHRQGWTMMVLKNQVLKTVRFNRILEHMRRGDGEYFLMAPDIARNFRREYVNHLRQRP